MQKIVNADIDFSNDDDFSVTKLKSGKLLRMPHDKW